MKKIILMLVVCALNFGAFAQSPYGTGSASSDSVRSSSLNDPDGFIKKDGKVMMVNGGQYTILKKDVTLSDGTVVKTNGSYKTKDGTKMELREGDHLDLNGKLSTLQINNNTNDNLNKQTK